MVRKISIEDMENVKGHCGYLKRCIMEKASFDEVDVYKDGATSHYHKKSYEYYKVLKGEAIVETCHVENHVNEIYELKKGDMLEIPPNYWHRIRPINKRRLKILVMGIPPINESDHFYH